MFEFTPEEMQWLINQVGNIPTKYACQIFTLLDQKVAAYNKAKEQVKSPEVELATDEIKGSVSNAE